MDSAFQSEFYRQLGANIRNLRKRRRLSQENLAQLIGLTRTSLTNIENGRQHPPLHTFCEIADQLKADVPELLPSPLPPPAAIDIETLARAQVRGKNELDFIETAIGLKGKDLHASTKTQDPGDDDGAVG